MNLGKLTKRLRKELLANPKQSAVLAVVCVIALWFWSPLLIKWFGGKPAGVAAVAGNAVTPAEVVEQKTEQPQHSWFEVRKWREADALTRSATLNEAARDPFRSLQPQVIAKTPEDDEQKVEPQKEIAVQPLEPEKLGFTLEAIVYGGSRRRAQINGQTVKENDQVTLGVKDEATELVAQVKEIRRSEVLLHIGGTSLWLKLQPKLLGRGEVVERTRRITQSSP